MFGLFGKKDMENSTFNNVLIASLGELVRRKNSKPSEEYLLEIVTDLANKQGYKLNQQQVGAVRSCAMTLKMSVGDEIYVLAGKMILELPLGVNHGYKALSQLLVTHCIIYDEAALDFLNFGKK